MSRHPDSPPDARRSPRRATDRVEDVVAWLLMVGRALAALQSDGFWRVPALRMADAHAGAPAGTYMYEFAWPSPAFSGLLGACHGLEIPFVFDTLDPSFRPILGPALGEDPPQQLAGAMHAAWVAFATSGDPGWPRDDMARRATMRFDTVSDVVDDPRAAERELWEGALP